MSKVIRIMFVCHGNICRSPMAEFVFKKICTDAGKQKNFIVSSSATSDEEIFRGIGNPVYPPARCMLRKAGIDCGEKRAVRLKASDYGNYDYFIGMDSANIKNMKMMLNGDPENKVSKLLEYTLRGGDVADPWYSGDFDTAYNDIFEGCSALFEKLCRKLI